MMRRVKERIRSQRRRLELDMLSSPGRRYYSPVYYGQYCVTVPLLERYARGRLIDLGCGDIPFRDVLIDRVEAYDSLDLFPEGRRLTYVSDIQDMVDVPSSTYDTAICLEVLEHVPDPFCAAREICRILAPGGILILSVPHLSRLHAEPYDFYRYTRHGIGHLLKQAGMETIELHERGALFTLVGHQVSTVLLTMAWGVPVLQQVVWCLNRWLVTRLCWWLDRVLPGVEVLPAGYTVVAVKPPLQP
jgi:SAM-dependent methyltransferase